MGDNNAESCWYHSQQDSALSLLFLICRLQIELNRTLQNSSNFLFSIYLLLSLGVLFCCYRCISSQVFIYSFIPYRWFKQFSSIRKSSKPMVRMPFSSLHGLMSSFTTMTFLKVSLILRREAVYFSLRRFFGNIATFSSQRYAFFLKYKNPAKIFWQYCHFFFVR